MELTVYLAGQIHDDWRERVRKLADERGLPLTFVGPQEDHDLSDNIGEKIKGTQPNNIFKDEAASEFNNLRTSILMQKADVVIALFGDKYRQWNTAMDASTALGNREAAHSRPPSRLAPCPERVSPKSRRRRG